MKTEIADKKLEILNWIFKSKDGASWNEVSEMLNEFEKVCKDEAIAEYEAAQWLLYPENQADLNTEYWVHDVWGSYYHSMGYNFDKNRVIAFLPKKKYPSFKGKEERK